MNEKGLKASEWANIVSEKAGGKAGGNEGFAQGSGSSDGDVNAMIELAQSFASKCLLK